jgi:hypothetical protein
VLRASGRNIRGGEQEDTVETTMLKNLTLALAALALAPMAAQAQVLNPANGHYYLFVGTLVTAEEAFAAAAATSYLGQPGYLATVTSADENAFVSDTVAQGALAWLGGSDSGAAVNDWTWRVGPEAGQAFTYTNWSFGEPNNCCTSDHGSGEDYIHTNWDGVGTWNDHGSPGNWDQANGYVIEYGGVVPESGTALMLLAGLAGVGAIARRRS